MIDQLPQYRAHLSRHGHNLSHKFDFTSSTGHLLTLFTQIMNPKETISGKIDMFSRTQPMNSPSHADIDERIDYFFVPLDMMYSGFGESLYQTNEPYSSMIKISPNTLPIVNFGEMTQVLSGDYEKGGTSNLYFDFNVKDPYGLDSAFMSYYRNLFHNYVNPNSLFNRPNYVGYKVPYDIYQPNVLPLSLMAYNCVYENFYRLDERESFDNTLYNIDASAYAGDSLFRTKYRQFASIKYRSLNFDYFTSAKVAPIINSLNINSQGSNTSLLAVNNYLSSLGILTRDVDGVTHLNLVGGVASVGINTSAASNLQSADIRTMFAVEKILSITGRAKKTYDAQVLAHLGVDVPRDVKHEITFIGSQTGSIKIGEIIAVAGTEDTAFGDMAGKGYGTLNNKSLKFTAPCHGIFIAIFSCVPKVSYYAPLEKHSLITSRLDFWHPEFEKLGMQPIFGYESLAAGGDAGHVTSVFGWQMRYAQYKERFDKISPAFAQTIISNWAVGGEGRDPQLIEQPPTTTFNTWSNWVISMRPYRNVTNLESVPLKNFLCSPYELNDLMSIRYGWDDPTVGNPNPIPDYWKVVPSTGLNPPAGFSTNMAGLFYRDPLLHFANIDFKLVSSMGENTLPDLNF